MTQTLTPENAAKEIADEKFSDAEVVLLAGSLIRGEGTRFSDLDLVVVYGKLENARRESFYYRGWPVEVFVHDVSTLKYFFNKVDAAEAFCSLPQMVVESVVIKDSNGLASELKIIAQEVIDKGPPVLTAAALENRRYHITDLIDDIREPRSNAELMASGAKLLEILPDFYFRSNNRWSANGKMLFRKLTAADPQLALKFESAFKELFSSANPAPCIELAEEILSANGGFLFDGFKSDAPADWREL